MFVYVFRLKAQFLWCFVEIPEACFKPLNLNERGDDWYDFEHHDLVISPQ